MNKHCLLILICLFTMSLFAPWVQSSESILKQMEEKGGLSFQMFKISPDAGESKTYNVFSIPLQAKFTPNRYLSFSIQLDQGYQSFAGCGFYGLSNLNINCRYLYHEEITFVGGFIAPTGTQKLNYNEINSTSAGRIPFINASLELASSGLGVNFGISYGHQMNEVTSFALGAAYYIRGGYTPIKDGAEYNPCDELLLAGGIEYGDKESFAIIADFQFSYYSEEQVAHKKFSKPGAGFAVSGTCFMKAFKLTTLFYKRNESVLTYGGAFKPPALINFKLHPQIFLPIIPYAGFEHTGEGTMLDAANLFLFGGYLENHLIHNFPFSPFLEISVGSTAGKTGLFGVKVGTQVTFQIY